MTTPDPLTRAAAKLRDSVGALPVWARDPWVRMGSSVVTTRDGVMATRGVCGTPERLAYGERDGLAWHIALTASPDVTEATAALLLAAAKARRSELDDDVYRTLHALAAAIERQET